MVEKGTQFLTRFGLFVALTGCDSSLQEGVITDKHYLRPAYSGIGTNVGLGAFSEKKLFDITKNCILEPKPTVKELINNCPTFTIIVSNKLFEKYEIGEYVIYNPITNTLKRQPL